MLSLSALTHTIANTVRCSQPVSVRRRVSDGAVGRAMHRRQHVLFAPSSRCALRVSSPSTNGYCTRPHSACCSLSAVTVASLQWPSDCARCATSAGSTAILPPLCAVLLQCGSAIATGPSTRLPLHAPRVHSICATRLHSTTTHCTTPPVVSAGAILKTPLDCCSCFPRHSSVLARHVFLRGQEGAGRCDG